MHFKYLGTLALLVAGSEASRKIFIDNDSPSAMTISIPLYGGIEIVGVSGSFGNLDVEDATGTHGDIIKNYSLAQCVPLFAGASKPLLRTNETYQTWLSLFGNWVWKGAWDPTYSSVYHLQDVNYDPDVPGAMSLINAVKDHPGEVEIYAAGMMTTIAQALSLWPELVDNVKALWIMGGFIDGQYAEVTGSPTIFDINTDFNLAMDPEASQMVLSAGFSDVYFLGNVTNLVFPSKKLSKKLTDKYGEEKVANVSNLFAVDSYVTVDPTLPLWDETTSAVLTYPDLIKSKTNVTVAIDTSYYSPFYGSLRTWPQAQAPKSGVGKAYYVNEIDLDKLEDIFYKVLTSDYSDYCRSQKITDL